MTPTRADLERLIETWRQTAYAIDRVKGYNEEARAYDKCADELAALLTSEGPASTEDLLPCIPSEPRPEIDVTRVKAALQMLRDLDMRPCDIDAIAPIERDALDELLDALNPVQRPETPQADPTGGQ